MAIGIPIGGGGDFLPVVKYDARAGRMFRVDRTADGNNPVDVSKTFKAVFDMENIETGWILFTAGGAPDFCLQHMGLPALARPSPDHKSGMRVVVRLSTECGGDVRELAGTSAAFLRGFDALHDAYLAGAKANVGKLPVAALQDTLAVESGSGAKRSTNYQPVFDIVGWVARPADLVTSPRPTATPAAPAHTNGAARPAATGSTPAPPPVSKPEVIEITEGFG